MRMTAEEKREYIRGIQDGDTYAVAANLFLRGFTGERSAAIKEEIEAEKNEETKPLTNAVKTLRKSLIDNGDTDASKLLDLETTGIPADAMPI